VRYEFQILGGGVLRADLRERETMAETREFIEAVFAEREKHGVLAILIVVSESRPLFKVEEYGLSDVFERVKAIPGLRVAGVTKERDTKAAHDYITLLAKQRNAPMRNFSGEPEALAWLREPRPAG